MCPSFERVLPSRAISLASPLWKICIDKSHWCSQSPSMCPSAGRRWICGWHKTDRHSSSLWPESFSPPSPRLLSSESSPQFGTPFCVISETFLQCSHCKSLWPCASGRRTASLRRSSHSTPNMKTYVVIKGLLIPRGTHSCETFLRRSSTAWWGVSRSLACCVLLYIGRCVYMCDYVRVWGRGGKWKNLTPLSQWARVGVWCVFVSVDGSVWYSYKTWKQHSRKAGWPRGRETD